MPPFTGCCWGRQARGRCHHSQWFHPVYRRPWRWTRRRSGAWRWGWCRGRRHRWRLYHRYNICLLLHMRILCSVSYINQPILKKQVQVRVLFLICPRFRQYQPYFFNLFFFSIELRLNMLHGFS